MNDLQQVIADMVVKVYLKQFSDKLSIDEFQECLEAQYTPMEFVAEVI